MKIGFVVNDIATELPVYTTVRLGLSATSMGHDVWMIGMGDFGYEPDGSLVALASRGKDKKYRSLERYLEDLQSKEARERVSLEDFDVIMLRADPADEGESAAWANPASLAFGELAARAGVLVVNDPATLSTALSKAYFQHFPEIVRPRTLISRDKARLEKFVEEMNGKAVFKPLQGSGGQGVFLVNSKESPNTDQMIEAIARDGYVVGQEFLPDAKNGDVRLFVMNGEPLTVDGQIAAFRRRSSGSDIRSNMSAGGKAEKAEVDDSMLALVDAVRPKLIDDGIFLAGLDIVGDKLMEVNVFSPGGLGSCETLYDIEFAPAVIRSLERKVEMRRHYGAEVSNRTLACL